MNVLKKSIVERGEFRSNAMAMTNNVHVVEVSPLSVAAAGALSLAVAMGIGRFAFTPMLPLMMQAGELDVGSGGWLAAANYLGYFLGAATASRLTVSPGRLSGGSLLAAAVLTAAMAIPGSPWLWVVLRLLAGVCSAWAFVGTSVWCLSVLARAEGPSWASGVYAGVGAGIAGAGLYCLVGSVAGVSAHDLWVQLGLLALLLTLPVLVVIRRVADRIPAKAHATSARGTALGTGGLVACYGILGFGYILPATFLPVLARRVVADSHLFGLAWPVFGLTAAMSTVVAGWAMRRASRLQVWATSHVLMAIGVLLPSLWHAGAAIAVSALLVGGTFMVVTMVGIQEIRARAHADPTALVGRMTAAFAMGQIAGPIASSLLVRVPALAAAGLNVALQVAAAALALSAAWLWRQSRVHRHGSRSLQGDCS
jgi:predicted MFS family arabinose efflux permease